jgi:hypothetical protein
VHWEVKIGSPWQSRKMGNVDGERVARDREKDRLWTKAQCLSPEAEIPYFTCV